MSDLAEQIKVVVQFPIDFPSQRWTEQVYTRLMIIGAIVACLTGVVTQDILKLVYVFVASIMITLLVVVPAWPQYNKSEPINWLEPKLTTTIE